MRLAKKITFSRFTVLVAWFLGCCLQLAAQENSPYSRYGLGDQVPAGNIINRAMGGFSAAYSDYQSINFANPASYSRLKVTTFDLGFEVDNRTLREPNNPGKFNASSANVSYVQLGIPLMPKRSWGLNLGLRPVTRVNYKVQTNARLTPPLLIGDSLQTLYEGVGGSYDVFAGTGIAFNNFSVGVNVAYSFGTKDYSTRKTFINDSVLFYQSNHQNKSTFGGFTFQGGAQYAIKLSGTEKKVPTWLRLGVTGQLERTLNANRDEIVETFEYDANGAVFRIDSVYENTNISGNVTHPSSFSAGFMVERENEWAFGADYTTSKWTKYQFFGEKDPLQNSWQLKMGGQFTPDLLRGKNYWSRITYRAGFFYGKDYIKVDNELPVFGVTAGAALPIRRNAYTNQFTVINTAFEIGRRGNDDNKIRENFFRISVGLSLSDLWFIKRKYD